MADIVTFKFHNCFKNISVNTDICPQIYWVSNIPSVLYLHLCFMSIVVASHYAESRNVKAVLFGSVHGDERAAGGKFRVFILFIYLFNLALQQ